jgi:putative ABC transport system permease protein
MKKKNTPPRWATQMLSWFSEQFNLPEVCGDLSELYFKRLNAGREKSAAFLFWVETFQAIPSMWFTYLRRKRKQPSNYSSMLTSNIIIGLRHFIKRPGYGFVTISGLAIGITSFLLLLDYIQFERSFDQFHRNVDRIAMVQYHFRSKDIDLKSPSVPFFVGPKLQREFSEVELQTRLLPAFSSKVFKVNENLFEENNFAFADSTVFDVLSFDLLSGDPKDQLRRPKTMSISRQTALRFFGVENPIGKTIIYNHQDDNIYQVTGVFDDLPPNSHIHFDFLLSLSSVSLPDVERFDSPNYLTYLLLTKDTDRVNLETKVNEAWREQRGEFVNLRFQSLAQAHFDTSVSNYGGRIKVTDPHYLFTFSIVAGLILLIACINYINLATARANERAREVGVRKLSGGSQFQLFIQFLTDSFLHILPAVLLALLLFFVIFPYSNEFLGLARSPIDLINNLSLVKWAIGILCVVTILAGIYPALILTRFRVVSALKGRFTKSKIAGAFRQGLVVFQFVISITLIISSTVVSSQLSFMQNKKLGYNKDHVLILPADAKLLSEFEAFDAELKKLSSVQQVVPMSASPVEIVAGHGMYLSTNDKPENFVTVGGVRTTEAILDGLNIKLLAGRNFTPHQNILTDSGEYEFMVNQTFLSKFGLTESEALGKEIVLGGRGKIIGIVSDFHTGSLHQKIEPIVMFAKPMNHIGIRKLLIKLSAGDMEKQLSDVRSIWKAFAPHRPFTYNFLDQDYDRLYKTEDKINVLIHLFSGLAIMIATLGILGLASYATQQRTKEIGVRKVLGASSSGIVVLVSKDFITLITLAFCIAAPVAFYLVSDWLQQFEYRITLEVYHFVVSGIVTFLFAFLIVCLQAFKASKLNPVETLKSE